MWPHEHTDSRILSNLPKKEAFISSVFESLRHVFHQQWPHKKMKLNEKKRKGSETKVETERERVGERPRGAQSGERERERERTGGDSW